MARSKIAETGLHGMANEKLVCRDCGGLFDYSDANRAFRESKGFGSPQLCRPCALLRHPRTRLPKLLETTDWAWRRFQDEVAALFGTMPGCTASVDQPMRGGRIGNVNVDVLAEWEPAGSFAKRNHGFSFTVIVECKFWNRPVSQDRVFGLKAIVEDVGAAQGILVSNAGIQPGAAEYLDHPSNIRAMTFAELQALACNGYLLTCSACGRQELVPFPAKASATALCSECFRRTRS